MTSVLEQKCPLCHRNAEYEFEDHKNLKHFYCSKCYEFLISRRAEKRLLTGHTPMAGDSFRPSKKIRYSKSLRN